MSENLEQQGPLRVLSAEDEPNDAELIEHILRDVGFDVSMEVVGNRADFVERLKAGEWDVIIADHSMPDLHAETALTLAQEMHPHVPFIVVSGTIHEEAAVELLRRGAADYLLKDRLSRLGPAVEAALLTAREQAARRKAETDLQATAARLKNALRGTVGAMGAIASLRDPYTGDHEVRVAVIAVAVAEMIGLDADRREGLDLAARVHDVGKLGVPAEILTKPSQLTALERALIEQHARVGFEILQPIDFDWPVAEMVLQHHERQDGSGYPRRLRGDEILMEARILAVADVVEAMSSHRPYRPARGLEAALEEIRSGAGVRYDADVARACIETMRSEAFRTLDPDWPSAGPART